MKIWCEECKGMQWIENNRCPFCKGEGYTENNDTDYQARVGRATIKAFDKGCWVTNMSGVYYENIDEFIESEGE